MQSKTKAHRSKPERYTNLLCLVEKSKKKKKKSQVTLNKSTKLKQRQIKYKTRAATALPHLHVVPWFILTTAGVVAHEEALKVATV